jgi:hypothetical protein
MAPLLKEDFTKLIISNHPFLPVFSCPAYFNATISESVNRFNAILSRHI